ncbi:hypothetical protein ACRAQ7_10495 [Erythrobacter sp. W53]|uniref:hypothetical protein n=1 Tax=Erythrobacter sp. W53 TaxID=3425947 RepID=UPI003D76A1DA
MSDESQTPATSKKRRIARRTPGDRLRDAIMTLGGHHGQVLSHDEKAWASITFAGTRHSFSLLFAGAEAVAAGEELIALLPEHEFTIAGQLVADAAVSSADHRMLPSPRLVVDCEILMLEEG